MIKESLGQLHDKLGMSMNRFRQLVHSLPLIGLHKTELWRRNQHSGHFELINTFWAKNDITTVGKNKLLDCMFNSSAQVTSTDWCAGLINNASFTGYNAADTISSHAGWTEWTSYSQTTRVAWTQGAASAAAVTNSSPMVFDINATGTIKGLFIVSQNTKGGTTGTLWSAASYTSTVDVQSGDQIRSTYSLSC